MTNDVIKSYFDENGYYLAKGVFDQEEILELEGEFDRIVDQLLLSGEQINATWRGAATEKLSTKDDVIIHTHNVHQYSASWLGAMRQKQFIRVTQAILGEDIVLHHNKLFQKPPRKGSAFPMHQDWSYFPTEKDTMIAAVVFLTNTTPDMGCFSIYPGSHKLGRLANTSGQSAEEHEIMKRYPIEGSTMVEAAAGDVLFFHYFTLHGSLPNRSQRTRKTVLIQMFSGQDQVEDGVDHPNENIVLSGWNHHASRNTAGRSK